MSRFYGVKVFEVRAEHVRLISETALDWRYDGLGGVAVSTKRPYGSSSMGDICRALGWSKEGDDGWGPCFTEKQNDAALAIHQQTEVVWEILRDNVTTGIQPGRYSCESGTWVKA